MKKRLLPLFLAVAAWALPLVLWAQDPFADLGTTASPQTGCDDIAARAAAQSNHIFCGIVVIVSLIVGIAIWWFIERKTWLHSFPRVVVASVLAALLAFALIAWNPTATDSAHQLMSNVACQHHFWLGATGAFGQGLGLGFAPTFGLAFFAILIVNKLV